MTELEPQYIFGEIEEIHDDIEKNYQKFNNFDILGNYPYSHNFVDKRGRPDHIAAQWESIRVELISNRRPKRESLAGSIFVRVYDQRVDLLSVMIVGREGDPYHQGLFFFDIFLPTDYLKQEREIFRWVSSDIPSIFYNSFGFDIHSSFRKDGTVVIDKKHKFRDTLELLNTLKDLVLNDKSYIAHSWRSMNLNRKVFVQTCEAMLKMLHSPPRPFKDFVLGYFRNRAQYILINFKGCFDIVNDDVMRMLFFKLVRALEANGSYCKHLYSQKQYDQALKQEEELLEKNREKQGSMWTFSQGLDLF